MKHVNSIEEILNQPIFTADGKKIGRVVDMELTPAPEFKVTTLLTGSYGILHRLHVLHPFARLLGVRPEPCTFPWNEVERIEPSKIILRIDHNEHLRREKGREKTKKPRV